MITSLRDTTIGDNVTVQGWVKSIRKQKNTFITLRDGIGKQCQLHVYVSKSLSKLVENVDVESFIRVTGNIRKLPPGNKSFKPFELEALEITVLGSSRNDFHNICPPASGRDIKLDQRHLYIRDHNFGLITKLRSILVRSLREFFDETRCTEIYPPSFVGNQCEGGSTLFKVSYPDKEKGDIPAYLTQSSQFYLEFAVPALGDCYCIAPSFRAERSHTRRHLTEFLHAECEWSGILTFEDHLEKLKALMIRTLEKFLEYGREYLEELQLVSHVEEQLEKCKNILVMSHREAIEYCHANKIYKDAETSTPFDFDDDIPEMQERQIIDQINKIVFLVKFPKAFKSFYFLTFDDDTVLGCDVEVPGVGEIIGSGVREYDHDKLRKSILDNGLNISDYKEYLDIRKYGAGRTSGMGLGVDRFLTWLLKCDNIRDVVTFPRVPGRLFP